jgi:hypothetical protein
MELQFLELYVFSDKPVKLVVNLCSLLGRNLLQTDLNEREIVFQVCHRTSLFTVQQQQPSVE